MPEQDRAETPEEWRDRMRSIGYMAHGRPSRRGVTEWKDPADGHRIKATTDELNNTVTEHNTRDDRVDVMIRPPHLRVGGGVREIPQGDAMSDAQSFAEAKAALDAAKEGVESAFSEAKAAWQADRTNPDLRDAYKAAQADMLAVRAMDRAGRTSLAGGDVVVTNIQQPDAPAEPTQEG